MFHLKIVGIQIRLHHRGRRTDARAVLRRGLLFTTSRDEAQAHAPKGHSTGSPWRTHSCVLHRHSCRCPPNAETSLGAAPKSARTATVRESALWFSFPTSHCKTSRPAAIFI